MRKPCKAFVFFFFFLTLETYYASGCEGAAAAASEDDMLTSACHLFRYLYMRWLLLAVLRRNLEKCREIFLLLFTLSVSRHVFASWLVRKSESGIWMHREIFNESNFGFPNFSFLKIFLEVDVSCANLGICWQGVLSFFFFCWDRYNIFVLNS